MSDNKVTLLLSVSAYVSGLVEVSYDKDVPDQAMIAVPPLSANACDITPVQLNGGPMNARAPDSMDAAHVKLLSPLIVAALLEHETRRLRGIRKGEAVMGTPMVLGTVGTNEKGN